MLRTSLVSGAWAFAPESHSRWQLAQMPRIARVLLQQTHQNQGPSFAKINVTSMTYNGEWASVGESVQPPGQFALGESRHSANRLPAFERPGLDSRESLLLRLAGG